MCGVGKLSILMHVQISAVGGDAGDVNRNQVDLHAWSVVK